MPLISNKDRYPNDSTLSKNDYLIGTDGVTGLTKTFQLDDLQSVLDSSGYTVAQMQTLISNSLLKEGVNYKITDAGSGDETIIVKASSVNELFTICYNISNTADLYQYDIDTDVLSVFSPTSGDMTKAVYDQANIAQQVVGTTATQTLTNKTLEDYSNHIHADVLHARAKATEDILKGQAVVITGYNSGEAAEEVALANNTTGVASGIAYEDITTGSFGLIVTAGILENVDTSNFDEGDILYVNGNGDLTETEPTTGFSQPIAYVLRSNANTGALQILATYPKQDAEDVRYSSSTSVKDEIVKLYGSVGNTGATLTFTQKDQVFNNGTPSNATTITVDDTGAISPSVAVFISDGTEVTSIVGADGETIRTVKGIQPTGETGMLIVAYDGTSFWPSWRSEAGQGDVQSVNGQTADENGNVSIDADDISATSTKLWATAAANGDGQTGGTPITLDRKEGGFTVGTPSSPSSAASFEINLTGAVAGAWAQIYWNGGADPSFSFTGTSTTVNTYPSGAIARASYDNIIILRYDGINITKTINAPVFYGDVVNQVKTETGTTYTLVLADNGKYIRHNNESAITVTIPVNDSVVFSVGTEITLEQMGAGTITVQGQDDSGGSGETVTFNTTDLVSQGQGKILVLKKVNTNVWNVIGGTSA